VCVFVCVSVCVYICNVCVLCACVVCIGVALFGSYYTRIPNLMRILPY